RTIFKQRALYVLSAAGGAPLDDCGKYCNHGKHAAHDVVDGSAGAQRPADRSGHVSKTAHHLRRLVETRAILVRAGEEPFERAIDELWFELFQLLITETQLVHGAGTEVLGHDIRALNQL